MHLYKYIEIELTETTTDVEFKDLRRVVCGLQEAGIRTSVDDFGTGYSSLSYLNKFPADLLKIDKSFIDEMNVSESSKQYVASIIQIGHIFGLDVISEGVETQEQLDVLKDIGCDLIQGFIWGRPLASEDAEKLMLTA